MNIVSAPLTNGAYGFPQGKVRRRKPTILACLHQTAGTASALAERRYANRADSRGPSATAYVDKDGTIVRAVDPVKYAAWSQGGVRNPDRTIPSVNIAMRQWPSVNFNEWVYESVEVCGRGPEPYNAAQFEAVAQLIARASKALNLPVNRSTVITHRDVNTVDRPNDPWPAATREARMKRIITRANAILHPAPAIVNHVVVAGDSLSEIASDHHITLAKLLSFPQNAKYRANPRLIHVGDIVRVK